MTTVSPKRWAQRIAVMAGVVASLCISANALAAKPIPAIYSEVVMTFAGQNYGFSGTQESFTQSENGGRVVFDLTTLGTFGDIPVPQIDVNGLDPSSNHWEVVSKVGHQTYTFTGTCASMTWSNTESGLTVRRLFLTCSTLNTPGSP